MKTILFSVLLVVSAQEGFAAGMEPTAKTPAVTPTPSSIRNTSDDTKKSTQQAQVVNLLVAGANFTQAYIEYGQCPAHQSACVMAAIHFGMGVMGLQQASADGSASADAMGSYTNTNTGTDSLGPSGGAGYDPAAAAKNEDLKKTKNFIDSMSGTELKPGQPFVYNPKDKTITSSKGKVLKVDDFGSAGAMAAAGISQGAIDSAMAGQKAVIAEAMKKAEKYKTAGASSAEESYGGGGGGGGSVAGSSGNDAADALAAAGRLHGASSLGMARDPAQLAGMQKDYNGEPIGVAGDSIFQMMTRRYKVKESQRSFYDESELLMQK